MTMNIGWGWKAAILYSAFAVGMVALVVASSRQKYDLVAPDYYKQELDYQNVLDAGKNAAALSAAIDVHANATNVIVELPLELHKQAVSGTVQFYSPVDKAWDKTIELAPVDGVTIIPRSELHNTHYTVKVSFEAGGTKYYQESELQLH
jgi:nitrogen fixation protein FixH